MDGTALPRPAFRTNPLAPGARPAAGQRRDHPRWLSVSARPGMRVIGTRRRVTPDTVLPAGFSRLESSERLYALLEESDGVVVCCQWTPETTKLIGRESFAAMKPGAILVNVARGEIIDEEALIAALAAGKLRGGALEVHVGECEHEPDRRLWDDERGLITPQISGGRDKPQHRG